MKLRKELRDFINWQRKNQLLKNELTIDYELAETYLEETEKQLYLYAVSSCNYYWMINTVTYSVDGVEVKKGRMWKRKSTDRAVINKDWRKATEEEVKTKEWYHGNYFNLMNL